MVGSQGIGKDGGPRSQRGPPENGKSLLISPIYPCNTWVFMGYYPQESLLISPISTMGTLLGVHPSLSLECQGEAAPKLYIKYKLLFEKEKRQLVTYPYISMGLEYLPAFTIKLS